MLNFTEIAKAVQSRVGDTAEISSIGNGIQVTISGLKYKLNFYYTSMKAIRTDTKSFEKFTWNNEQETIKRHLAKAAATKAKQAVKAVPVVHIPPTGFDAYVAKIKRTAELYKENMVAKGKPTNEDNQVVVILNDLVRQADQYRQEV